jgi:transcriptional regulator with XRE-family HTH domain
LPYLSVTLKTLKPKEFDFEPSSLGEHVRKRRGELGLSQKMTAKRLGVSWSTALNWETGTTEPLIESIPAIIAFFGYDPFPKPTSPSEQLAAVRRAMGWTVKEAARQLGVDSGTWGRWEKTGIPWKRHRAIVDAFLEAFRKVTCAQRGPRRRRSTPINVMYP